MLLNERDTVRGIQIVKLFLEDEEVNQRLQRDDVRLGLLFGVLVDGREDLILQNGENDGLEVLKFDIWMIDFFGEATVFPSGHGLEL